MGTSKIGNRDFVKRLERGQRHRFIGKRSKVFKNRIETFENYTKIFKNIPQNIQKHYRNAQKFWKQPAHLIEIRSGDACRAMVPDGRESETNSKSAQAYEKNIRERGRTSKFGRKHPLEN